MQTALPGSRGSFGSFGTLILKPLLLPGLGVPDCQQALGIEVQIPVSFRVLRLIQALQFDEQFVSDSFWRVLANVNNRCIGHLSLPPKGRKLHSRTLGAQHENRYRKRQDVAFQAQSVPRAAPPTRQTATWAPSPVIHRK